MRHRVREGGVVPEGGGGVTQHGQGVSQHAAIQGGRCHNTEGEKGSTCASCSWAVPAAGREHAPPASAAPAPTSRCRPCVTPCTRHAILVQEGVIHRRQLDPEPEPQQRPVHETHHGCEEGEQRRANPKRNPQGDRVRARRVLPAAKGLIPPIWHAEPVGFAEAAGGAVGCNLAPTVDGMTPAGCASVGLADGEQQRASASHQVPIGWQNHSHHSLRVGARGKQPRRKTHRREGGLGCRGPDPLSAAHFVLRRRQTQRAEQCSVCVGGGRVDSIWPERTAHQLAHGPPPPPAWLPPSPPWIPPSPAGPPAACCCKSIGARGAIRASSAVALARISTRTVPAASIARRCGRSSAESGPRGTALAVTGSKLPVPDTENWRSCAPVGRVAHASATRACGALYTGGRQPAAGAVSSVSSRIEARAAPVEAWKEDSVWLGQPATWSGANTISRPPPAASDWASPGSARRLGASPPSAAPLLAPAPPVPALLLAAPDGTTNTAVPEPTGRLRASAHPLSYSTEPGTRTPPISYSIGPGAPAALPAYSARLGRSLVARADTAQGACGCAETLRSHKLGPAAPMAVRSRWVELELRTATPPRGSSTMARGTQWDTESPDGEPAAEQATANAAAAAAAAATAVVASYLGWRAAAARIHTHRRDVDGPLALAARNRDGALGRLAALACGRCPRPQVRTRLAGQRDQFGLAVGRACAERVDHFGRDDGVGRGQDSHAAAHGVTGREKGTGPQQPIAWALHHRQLQLRRCGQEGEEHGVGAECDVGAERRHMRRDAPGSHGVSQPLSPPSPAGLTQRAGLMWGEEIF
eukprot:scaffold7757_cov107-Isochrysis_galbana.AAC.3